MRHGYVYDSDFCFQFDLWHCVEGLVLVLLSLFLVKICYFGQAQRNLKFAEVLGLRVFICIFTCSQLQEKVSGRMLVMLDKQVSWLFLCWNMILLGSFYDTMTNKQHEIVFLDTNNNFKHLIFICLSRHTVKKRITCFTNFS